MGFQKLCLILTGFHRSFFHLLIDFQSHELIGERGCLAGLSLLVSRLF